MRLDSLWAEALGGKHIDFLKVDIDKSWQKIGMERVLSERGASLIVMEVDISWPKLADKLGGVTHLDQLCWRAVKQGYTPLLKVPLTLTLTLTLPLPLTRPTASAAAPRMLVISSMSGTPYISLYLPASPQILLDLPISQRMLAISRMSGSRIRTLAQSLALIRTLHLSMAVTTTQPELPS